MYIYERTEADGRLSRVEAKSIAALADDVLERWSASNSNTKVHELDGKARFPGVPDKDALRILSQHVSLAKQRFDMRVEFECNQNAWAYVPPDPTHDVISASHLDDLTAMVVDWGVRATANERADRGALAAAARRLRRGTLYHACEQVRRADEWLETVERCIAHAYPGPEEMREICATRALKAARHFAATHYCVGVLEELQRNAEDDEGRRHALLAVIDMGDRKRRFGVAVAREHDSLAIDQLIGKEVEIEQYRAGVVRLREVPSFAQGFSSAARQKRPGGALVR